MNKKFELFRANEYTYQRETVDYHMDKINFYLKNIKKIGDLKYKGKIILPTGAGKTLTMGDFQIQLINNVFQYTCTYGVFCHRLDLIESLAARLVNYRNEVGVNETTIINMNSNDIMGFAKILVKNKINVEVYSNGWEDYGKNHGKKAAKVRLVNFASFDDIEGFVADEKKAGRDVLFTILYQSMNKILNTELMFDFAFYDEAHITTAKEYFDMLEDIEKHINVNLFFTATKVNNTDGKYDMNNEDIYGEYEFNKHPFELVEGKFICPVQPIILDVYDKKGKNKKEYNETHLVRNQIESIMYFMDSLEKHIKEDSHDKRHALGFVSVPGNLLLEEIRKNACSILDWARKNETDIFLTSAEYNDKRGQGGGAWIYRWKKDKFEKCKSKETFMNELLMVDGTTKTLIVQINQLNEGIDLPGINGVLYLRESGNLARYIQFIGRSVRRDNEDRPFIHDENIKWNDKNAFVKPVSYVYIVTNTQDNGEMKRVEDILDTLYTEYGKFIFKSLHVERMRTKKGTKTQNASQNIDVENINIDGDKDVVLNRYEEIFKTIIKAEQSSNEKNKQKVKDLFVKIVKLSKLSEDEVVSRTGVTTKMSFIEMIERLVKYLQEI